MKRGEDPVNEKAFICHREAHWFTLRKLKDTWYNLNSLNEQPGPQRIGEFYLSALLDNIQSDGYTIFVIRGEYPETQKDFWPELNENQFWVPKSLLDSNIRDESQDDIAKAIEESLRSQESQPDPELEFAILLSMQEEQDRLVQPSLQVQDVLEILPEYQGESAFLLRLRLPDGKLETKYFLPECKLEDVKNWGKFISKREVQLVEPYPRRVLTELSQSLLETGLGPLNNFLILEYI